MAIVFNDVDRLIEIEAPATEVTIQDLLDAIRDYEDELDNIDLPKIANCYGKQFLGGTTYVGLTIELLDGWRVKFEDRAGPDYVQCSVTGGNIIAYDQLDVQQFPLTPSTYVFATITASASATLQEQDALQYSSFNGGVTVDIVGGTAGTAFPAGTPQQPVLTLADAMTIAEARGFTTLYVLGDITINAGDDYTGMTFVGESTSKSTFTIESDAIVANCEFYEATVTGVLDGNAKIQDCQILDLTYIYGVVERCLLGPGTITLGGSNEAHFLDCWSGVIGTPLPTINCGGSGQPLAVRNFNGCLNISNKSGTDTIVIDLNVGRVTLASNVTNGVIRISGVGEYTYAGTGATIDSSSLISNASISDQVWDETLADHTTVGSTGEALDNVSGGSSPSDIADAVWDEAISGHTSTGTFGKLIQFIKTLIFAK